MASIHFIYNRYSSIQFPHSMVLNRHETECSISVHQLTSAKMGNTQKKTETHLGGGGEVVTTTKKSPKKANKITVSILLVFIDLKLILIWRKGVLFPSRSIPSCKMNLHENKTLLVLMSITVVTMKSQRCV